MYHATKQYGIQSQAITFNTMVCQPEYSMNFLNLILYTCGDVVIIDPFEKKAYFSILSHEDMNYCFMAGGISTMTKSPLSQWK